MNHRRLKFSYPRRPGGQLVALHQSTMFELFRRRIPRWYPGMQLIELSIIDSSTYAFKKSIRYLMTLRDRSGKVHAKNVRGNVPSVDTQNELRVSAIVQRSIYAHGFSSGMFRTPRHLGIIPRLRLALYEEYPGVTLSDLIRQRDKKSVFVVNRAGHWLARLHGFHFRFGPRRSFFRIVQESGYFLDDVNWRSPRHAKAVAGELRMLIQSQRDLCRPESRRSCTIHGDLNLSNIISGSGDDVALIDFGGSCVTDPLSDVGNFLAQLDLVHACGLASEQGIRRLARSFLSGYRSGSTLTEEVRRRIDLHHAWWTMQILAYTLSTKPRLGRSIAWKLIGKGTALLRQHGYRPLRPLEQTPRKVIRPRLQNTDVMFDYFSRHLLNFFPAAIHIVGLSIQHQGALSGTSFLMRYTLIIRMKNGRIEQRNVRGNFVRPGTYSIMERLMRYGQRRFETLRTLRYEHSFHYVFYEELDGVSLRNIPFRSPEFRRSMPAIGSALASLQVMPDRHLPSLPWSKERQHLKRIRNRLRSSRSMSPLMNRALRTLEVAERRTWKTAVQGLVHNDYQASNILITARGIGLIDFTDSGRGPVAVDLGTFITHLSVMLHGMVSPRQNTAYRTLFLRSYGKALRNARFQSLLRTLPIFELRSCLDVYATTAVNLGVQNGRGAGYASLLRKRIACLLEKVTP